MSASVIVPPFPKDVIVVPDVVTEQVSTHVNRAVDLLEAGVETATAAEMAQLTLVDLQRLKTRINRATKDACAPFQDVIAAIKGAAENVTGPIDEAQGYLKEAIAAQVQRAKDSAALVVVAATEAQEVAAPVGRLTPIIPRGITVERAPEVSTYEHREVLVTNADLIPREYLTVDMPKLRKAVLAGISVPGAALHVEHRVAAR